MADGMGIEPAAARSNYFIGMDPNRWRTGIPNYAKVKCQEVYPGIDIIYHGEHSQLEYDFDLRAGADPASIRLAFDGLKKIRIDGRGDLILQTAFGEVRQHRPLAYQQIEGARKEVFCRYSIKNNGELGFELSGYDKGTPLTIDPVLSYSSYLGGSDSDIAQGIAVDRTGSAYITGKTYSVDFPGTPNGLSPGTVFVTKLNPAGTEIIYSTYLGGTETRTRFAPDSRAYAIALGPDGSAYITGLTNTLDYPITPGAIQTSLKSGGNAFVTKLNAMGTALAYSTFLGGTGNQVTDIGYGIAVDAAGSAYVTGYTEAADFPTSAGAFDITLNNGEAFITKLNVAGTGLIYSTFLGGNDLEIGFGIAVDASGNAYVTGETASSDFPITPGAFQPMKQSMFSANAFITKMNATGDSLIYSTYLGGEGGEVGYGIAIDALDNAYVTGRTTSYTFPVTPNAFQGRNNNFLGTIDGFVTKLNPAGTSLAYSTYLGGWNNGSIFRGYTICYGIAVDSAGSACVTGSTSVANYPTTANALQPVLKGVADVFVTKLSPDGGSALYSSYFGGEEHEEGYAIALDSFGAIYVAGYTASANLTTVNPIQRKLRGDADVFMIRLLLRPRIIAARVKGKKLLLTGEGFDDGAIILLDGQPQATANDDQNPSTLLVSKTAGRKIVPGIPVQLQVKGPDDIKSEAFTFIQSP